MCATSRRASPPPPPPPPPPSPPPFERTVAARSTVQRVTDFFLGTPTDDLVGAAHVVIGLSGRQLDARPVEAGLVHGVRRPGAASAGTEPPGPRCPHLKASAALHAEAAGVERERGKNDRSFLPALFMHALFSLRSRNWKWMIKSWPRSPRGTFQLGDLFSNRLADGA